MTFPQDARHIAAQDGDYTPQHQNMWVIEIAGLDGDDKDLIVLSLHSGALPNEENNIVELPYGNETRKVAGKAVYEDIPLVIKDFVDRETREALVRWRRKVYDPTTGNVGLPKDYKKEAEIILQDTQGGNLRSQRLIGVWPSKLEGGELSMESDEQVLITLTLTFDRAL